jgi:hypothetical protein
MNSLFKYVGLLLSFFSFLYPMDAMRLSTNKSKSKIIYNQSHLNDHMIGDIAKKVLVGSKASVLELNQNKFGDKGLETLIEILPSTQLRFIWARSNRITEKGLQSLCSFLLSFDSPLSYIDLRGNPISQEGFCAMTTLLKVKPYLVIQVGKEDAANLIETTLKNTICRGPYIVINNAALYNFINKSERILDSTRAAVVKQLIDHQANVNFQMPNGYTPLHRVVEVAPRNKNTIAVLCMNGAQLELRDNQNNLTPLELACKVEFLENARAILEYQKEHVKK